MTRAETPRCVSASTARLADSGASEANNPPEVWGSKSTATRGCGPGPTKPALQTSQEASCAAQLDLDDFDERCLLGKDLADDARRDAALR